MFRRANSNRLSRRKSTSSIPTKNEHIDPEVARQQAQAAATYAFARANERANTESSRSVEVSREFVLGQHQKHIRSDEASLGRPGVRRQQSVRFTGPEAVKQRRSIGTKALRGSLEDKVSKASLRPRAITNNLSVPAAYRPPSRSSSIGKASIDKGTAQSIVTALAAYDEYYTREDDIASTPSSYRRMRRSKSARTLSSLSEARKATREDVAIENDYNARIWNKVPWISSQQQQHQQPMRGPKSMSFLRGGEEYMTPAVREDHDNAVQMARDKFLHQIEQQRLREQPSFLFRTKERREGKTFRQSVRSDSTGSYGNPIGSVSYTATSKEVSLRMKARKASWTIKKRLKELFRRGEDQMEKVKIPNQQVEAHISHGRTDFVSVSKVQEEQELNDVRHPDSVTISKVASRQPSLYSAFSGGKLNSRNGSIHSQRSEGSGKSRVTSCTSTVDNTATSRRVQVEKEAQRLSIIQENGTHTTSASSTRLGGFNQLSAYPILHQPQSAQRLGNMDMDFVDSQKVYSALMKRTYLFPYTNLLKNEEESLKGKLEVRCSSVGEGLGPGFTIPLRSTSVSSHHSSRTNQTPATIRHVQDGANLLKDDKMMPNDTITSLSDEDDDVFSPQPLWNINNALASHNGRNCLNTPRELTARDVSYTAYPLSSTSEGTILPPQQQAARNERLLRIPKPARETRSTFFGTSSITINRSTSPYRRVLAEADYSPVAMADDRPASNRILFAPPIVRCSDPKETVAKGQLHGDEAYSESIYSRTTSGQIPAVESTQSLSLVQAIPPFDNSSSATLLDRQTYQPTGPTSNENTFSIPATKGVSLRGEAMKIDKSGGADKMVSINYALPSMPKYFGHFREHAQIIDDGIEISQSRVHMDKQSIGMIQQKATQMVPLKPILKRRSSTSLDGFPMPPPPPPPLPPPIPPPIPLRSPLRTRQSRASLRFLDGTGTYQTLSAPASIIKQRSSNDHQLLRPISLASINRIETPAKLLKRNGKQPYNQHDPSPGIEMAVEKQFGSVGSRTPYSGVENFIPSDANRVEHYGLHVAHHGETDDGDAQIMGSRVMVDMFLSSRRKRVAGSDESNAFL